MARTRLGLFVVIGLTAMANGQNASRSCEAPREVAGLKFDQVKARVAADPENFQLLRLLIQLAPQQPKPAPLAGEFEKKLREHPKDPAYVYLAAAALVGKDTPQSIELLKRVAEADPAIPWTYLTLAGIHLSANFKDYAKLRDEVRAFRKLCPASFEAFTYLDKFDDPAELPAMAAALRQLLEEDQSFKHAELWSKLWAAEFRLAGADGQEKQRQRVAADVARLERVKDSLDDRGFYAVIDGLRLTGRTVEADKLHEQKYPDIAFQKIHQNWSREHQINRRLTDAERIAWAQDQAKTAAEWVEKWPEARMAWMIRLSSLPFTQNWTKEQVEFAGEQVLKRQLKGWTYIPDGLRVAQTWVRYGVRLADCEKMGQSSLDEILEGPEVRSDLYAQKNQKEIDDGTTFGFDLEVWEAMSVVLEAQAKLKEFDKARATLGRMQQWLDDNIAKQNDPSKGYAHHQGEYFYGAGLVAEAEGHKLDAASLYARAVASGWHGNLMIENRPHQFWLDQGGTEEGWVVASKALPRTRPQPAQKPASTPLAVREGPSYWQTSSSSLREMKVQDTTGKTWTLADIKGKPTFLAVWATWCTPCREELSYVQKIYDLLKSRKDIQLVTLNIDDNPGEVAPVMESNHFTFPVLLARKYMESEFGHMVIPQTWIVDRAGVIRQESWFDSAHTNTTELERWPQQVVEKLAKLLD